MPRGWTVVFDVDGTLVDSERDGHRPAFNEAFAEFGLPYRWNEQEYGELLTVAGGRHRLRGYLQGQGYAEDEVEELAAKLHARKTELFVERVSSGSVPGRPGVVRLLDELAEAAVPVAVATTGSRAWVEPLLRHSFGLDRFALVLTGDEVPELKPSPAVYAETLARLHWPAGSTVAVEDSRNGLLAARAAGMPCLVVVNDYSRDQDFTEAALVVDGFGQPGTAHVLRGTPDGLADGAVTVGTLARLAGDRDQAG